MPHIALATCVAVALHHGRAECRTNDLAQRQHHRSVMCDVIESSAYPHLVLAEVIRRLGRVRALQVEIDPAVINAAVRTPKIFEGRL